MRRASLLTMAVLGLLVIALGGSGLFAGLTDTADLGPNQADSAPLAASADLKLAYYDVDPAEPNLGPICGTFQDDLVSTPFLAVSGLTPGSSTGFKGVCLRNSGSQTVATGVLVQDLADTEQGCTGDEAGFDATCGTGSGELSVALLARFEPVNCSTGTGVGLPVGDTVWNLSTGALTLPVDLVSGAEVCYWIQVVEPGGAGADALQAAQSDSATWTFRFQGVVPAPAP